jgi:hypothetical protein
MKVITYDVFALNRTEYNRYIMGGNPIYTKFTYEATSKEEAFKIFHKLEKDYVSSLEWITIKEERDAKVSENCKAIEEFLETEKKQKLDKEAKEKEKAKKLD